MARKELPPALTLERFAAGKDGRANAFKKKKQANKRKLFEKAQLKRQYAKLLKKEGATAIRSDVHDNVKYGEAAHSKTMGDVGDEEQTSSVALSTKREREERANAGETNYGCDDRDGRDEGQQRRNVKDEQQDPGKRRRPEHRPDSFKAAKATAGQRRQEMEEKKRERDVQQAEKSGRAKKRRKQHALLSKRTKGGQPVMKHTMQYLLEKIQAQR